VLGLIALLRKAGGTRGGLEALQRQIALAQERAAAQIAAQDAARTGRPAPPRVRAATAPNAPRQPQRPVPPPSPATHAAVGAPTSSAAGKALLAAFHDPSHARTAVVLAEILAPPVALR
jgi:hypothetical protein